MQILKVFTNERGDFGNPVGIVIDTDNKIEKVERQKMATDSGFSEIVFVNNLENREISIYTPVHEIPFAGHAVVGAAYYLSQKYQLPVTQLKSIGGVIETWIENKLTWVKSSLDITPNWNYQQLSNEKAVEQLSLKDAEYFEHTFVWAWVDESKGIIRARTFASDWGIPEDEANGSGSMKLADQLKREIIITHGKGSIIHARPSPGNNAEVGGLVKIIE